MPLILSGADTDDTASVTAWVCIAVWPLCASAPALWHAAAAPVLPAHQPASFEMSFGTCLGEQGGKRTRALGEQGGKRTRVVLPANQPVSFEGSFGT